MRLVTCTFNNTNEWLVIIGNFDDKVVAEVVSLLEFLEGDNRGIAYTTTESESEFRNLLERSDRVTTVDRIGNGFNVVIVTNVTTLNHLGCELCPMEYSELLGDTIALSYSKIKTLINKRTAE